MSVRQEKVASVIKRALSRPVSEIASENSAGMVTVTAVRLSPDLSVAKVYISLFGKKTTPAKIISILEARKGEMRHIIGKAVKLRITPDLRFFYDDTLDQIEHIQKLLDGAKLEDEAMKKDASEETEDE